MMRTKEFWLMVWNELKGDIPYLLLGLSFIFSLNILVDVVKPYDSDIFSTVGLLVTTTLLMIFLSLPKHSN